MSEERLLIALDNDFIARQSLRPEERRILQLHDERVNERTEELGESATYGEMTRVLRDVQSMIPGSAEVIEKYEGIFRELESTGIGEQK